MSTNPENTPPEPQRELTQEEIDAQNPYWRPEWRRKRKRHFQTPEIKKKEEGREKNDCSPILHIPQHVNISSPGSLFSAMIEYFTLNPEKMLPSDFFVDLGISESILEDFEPELLNSAEIRHLKKRAYTICENRIVNCALRSHTNPATTIFLLKNKFGYVDKTESKSEISGKQAIEITFKMPMPAPLPRELQQDSAKELDPDLFPNPAPNVLEIEAKPETENQESGNEEEK